MVRRSPGSYGKAHKLLIGNNLSLSEGLRNFGLEEMRQQDTDIAQAVRNLAFVNCWHGGDTESAAMWKLYGTASGSVVVQSTYENLVRVLPAHDDTQNIFFLGVGMIQYLHYLRQDWIPVQGNVITPFLYKRKEFEYEREVRALAFVAPPPENRFLGIRITVDVHDLVESIRVQPTTPTWAREAIRDLISKYGLTTRVKSSQIDIAPPY